MRGRTLTAMLLLCAAWFLVTVLPFRYWRETLGRTALEVGRRPAPAAARRYAAHVERAAQRLPFAIKCLPRAMALCWLLRAADVGYVIKIAARPSANRQASPGLTDDTLHAWVECGGATVIGALPGPWLVVLTLYG